MATKTQNDAVAAAEAAAAVVEAEMEKAAEIEEEEEGDEEDEEDELMVVASTQAEPPIAIPADFKGQRIPVSQAALTVSTLAQFATQGNIDAAINLLIAQGGVLVVNDKKSVFLHADNREWVLGALASLPSLRETFRPMVMAAVTAARGGNEYQMLLASYTKTQESLMELHQRMVNITKSAAGAFPVDSYVNVADIFTVTPKIVAVGTASKSGTGKRAKTARPTLGRYAAKVDENLYVLTKTAEGWQVEDEYGTVVSDMAGNFAVGDNHTTAGNALFDILRPGHANMSIPREFKFKEQNEWAEQGIDEQGRFDKIRGL